MFYCQSSCFFFFSSRRRHTRCLSDWSSDVCSSDLAAMAEARAAIADLEADLDAHRLALTGAEIEAANAALVRLKDAVWAIASDRLRAAREVMALASGGVGGVGDAALEGYWAVNVAL